MKPTDATSGAAACALRLPSTGNTLKLLPCGAFRARDGRPSDTGAWRLDASNAAAMVSAATGDRIVIDYEHQTLAARENGQPAPAAGWFTRIEWREGDGLYATDVEWTERARDMIQAGEYLYISPVFTYDRISGAVLRLVNAALTNTPALMGMDEVTALRDEPAPEPQPPASEAPLPALLAMQTEFMTQLAALRAELAARAAPAAPESEGEVVALREQCAGLQEAARARELDDVIDAALSDGRLPPAHIDVARTVGRIDLAALRTLLDRPPLLRLGVTQTGGIPPAERAAAGLTDEDLFICKATGRDPEAFARLKAQAGAHTPTR